MKQFLALTLIAALVAVCGPAQAAKVWDDMSWWGKTGATPEPQPESGKCPVQVGRCGFWWWPTEPASNANDGELWGNRGIVYQPCREEVAQAPTVETPKAEPPKVIHPVPVYNNVLFDFDKAVLKPEGKAVVDQVAADLKKWGKDTIVIEGHTCDIGSDAYNMGLGQRRADSVKRALLESGIAEARVTTKSLGETQPAVANDSAANRKLNRRAVFVTTVAE